MKYKEKELKDLEPLLNKIHLHCKYGVIKNRSNTQEETARLIEALEILYKLNEEDV